MASPEFVFYLTCLLLGKMAQINHLTLSSTVQQDVRFISVNVGDSFTLQCVDPDDGKVGWYKQTLGQKLRLICVSFKFNKMGVFYHEFKNNPRFTLENNNNVNSLSISDVQLSDSATYYCVKCHSTICEYEEGVTVSVEGSDVNVQTLVHQASSENIQPGGSVTLSCTVHTGTCDGEHSVYWFKNSEEHQPGLLYTHGDKRDQCERKPDTQTHTCVYNLSLRSLKSSHAGTYYCAVASCGHILFGNGTKLDFGDKVGCLVIMYTTSVALAITTILCVLLAFLLYKRSEQVSTPDDMLHQDSDNLYYAAFKDQTMSRSRKPRDDIMTECVYTAVKLNMFLSTVKSQCKTNNH